MNAIVLAIAKRVSATTATVAYKDSVVATVFSLLPNLLGKCEKDVEQVYNWTRKCEVMSTDLSKDADAVLQTFHAEMCDKTYLVGNAFGVADIFMYCTLHNTMAKLGYAKRSQFANVTRYFDLCQNCIREYGDVDSILRSVDICVQVEGEERLVEEKKKKTGDEKKVQGADANIAPDVKKDASEKKEGKSKKEKVKAPASVATPTALGPARISFRVGKVLSVEKHPQADSLYVEKIDLGEAEPRVVVSGLVKHYSIEQFVNRMVVLVCNLKPAKMRGIESAAMVLCASNEEKVELVEPPLGSVVGDVVWFDGYQGEPNAMLKSKDGVWEGEQVHFKTNQKRECVYLKDGKQSSFMTTRGVCTVPSIIDGALK